MKIPHLLALLGALCSATPVVAAPQQLAETTHFGQQRVHYEAIPGEREFSGRLIARPVQLEAWSRDGLSSIQAMERIATARMAMASHDVVRHVSATDEYIFRVPVGATENAIAQELLLTGNFQYVEPDWLLAPIACPDDSSFNSQWHHQSNIMQSCSAWDLHTGNPSVGIGICDTGVLTSHEDLQLNRLEGYNAVDRQWESQGGNVGPVHPHGTNTTGCAAANGNNGVGVSGVGWNLSHRMLRVSNVSGGNAYMSDLQHAARTSIEAGDKVASVSYSGADSSSNLTTGTYIKSIGGLLVWAAGNDGRNLNFGNRDADDIIVVGATDSGDSLAWFSAYGQFVDVVAPGVSVVTTDSNGNSSYTSTSGTSFACPITAGLCGLIWSADPTLTPDEVEAILKQSVNDLGANGADNTYGHGRVNSFAALTLVGGGGGGGGGGTPPVADFSGTPTTGTVPFDVVFSDLSSGTPSSWSWDFGDGTTSTQQNPTHTYTTAGAYTVSLTATNADGSDNLSRLDYITANAGGGGGGGVTGEGFILSLNADHSTDDRAFTTGDTLYMLMWSDAVDFNDMKKAQWELRDPNGNKIKQNLTNNGDGTFTAVFALSGLPSNATDWTWKGKLEDNPGTRYRPSTQITVGAGGGGTPPVADFSGTPTTGTVPLTVDFTDLSSGAPDGWSWDFGDGATSSQQNPTHVYNAVGVYSVSLTASNADGSDQLTRVDYITVDPVAGNPPVADFVGLPTTGTAPLDVVFTDLSSGTPTAWSWDFGDGASSTQQNPNHVYTAAGTYTVSLMASNANGQDTLVLAGYVTVSPGGGYTGEGFILSKNPDFSTDDRTFSRTDTIYMMAWSDAVDFTDIKKAQWELRDPNKNKVKQNFTNNSDGTYSASFSLASLPSSATSWRWKGKVEDNAGSRYRPSTNITVLP